VQTENITPEVPVSAPEVKPAMTSLLDQIKNFKKDSLSRNIDTPASSSDVKVSQPDIIVSAPDITETEVKSGFTNLFENIKSKFDSSGSASPKITQVGLGSSTPGHDSPQLLSPLKSKPSISNLFDDTEALFDDDSDIVPEISQLPSEKPRTIPTQLSSENLYG